VKSADASNVNIDDSILVERCKHGDLAAMERLILRYQNRIYNVILKMSANVDDALELTQETFVKIIENINGFEGKSSFYTWIFRIAVNLTINYCSKNYRHNLQSLDLAIDNDGQLKEELKKFIKDDNSPDPAMVAQNNELCKIIAKSLMKLEEEQRAVLILRDIEGMDYARIADVLEVNLGTVKSRLSRARNNLRGIVEEFLK
jgi:RNA polymerase sigma-70 factor, ECF subfamily